MKKIGILFSLLLVTLTSCNKPNDIIGPATDIERYTFEGVHDFYIEETSTYLVRNKTTNYKILLPKDADSYLYTAKEELTEIFNKATGIILDTVVEDMSTGDHTENQHYISIGDTHMFETSGLTYDKDEIGTQAVRIMTKDNMVYLLGGDTIGCLFAVYDFLEIYFDFDAYSYDCINITKKDDVKFLKLDVTDIPDISMRANSWGFIKENPNNIANRLRTPVDFAEYFLQTGDTEHGEKRGAIHNSLEIVPPRVYQSSHPGWFSTVGSDPITQICYTARGNESELEALIQHSANIIIKDLIAFDPIKYPLRNTVTFTMEDNVNICGCPACLEAKNKYGTDVGAVIVFCNRLMEKIATWMEANPTYARRDFKLLFFAYSAFINAPAHWEESEQKYVVNHPDLIMRDDVGVYFACDRDIQYQLDIYDAQNQNGLKNYKMWVDISPSLYLWTYNANFGEYLAHVNSTNFYNNHAYQFIAHNKAKLLYNQGGWNYYNLTAFQMLAIYLDAKLSWNSNLDMDVLIDNWFKGMFKDAASDMRKLYEAENVWSVIQMENIGKLSGGGIINASLGTREHWPYNMLKDWLGYCNDAWSKIKVYEEIDIDLYRSLKEHIDLEWVSPAYFAMSLWGRLYLSDEVYDQMAAYFKSEILPLKDFLPSERSPITLSNWIQSL